MRAIACWLIVLTSAATYGCADEAGSLDASFTKPHDAQPADTGASDAVQPDAALFDADNPDAGAIPDDAASLDATNPDARTPGASSTDASRPDALPTDVGFAADAGPHDGSGAPSGPSIACHEARGDYLEDVLDTPEGSTLVGYTKTYYGVPMPTTDALIIRRAPEGAILWQKRLGGAGDDAFAKVLPGPNGDVIAVGGTTSHSRSLEVWIVRFDRDGNVSSEVIYPGSFWDEAYNVLPTSDGGHLLVGYTGSFDNAGYEGWAIKLAASGAIEWQKTYGDGGSSQDRLFAAVEVPGGYILSGRTSSFGVTYEDLWLLRIDEAGAIEWQYRYNVGVDDRIYAALPAPGGVYLSGYTNDKLWALKVDLLGNVAWSKLIDNTGADTDVAFDAELVPSGFVAGGYSFDTHVFGQPPGQDYDFFFVKLDDAGNLDWHRVLGGSEAEWVRGMAARAAGGIIATGWSKSFAGVGLEPGSWVVELEANGSIVGRCDSALSHASTLAVEDAPPTRVVTPGVSSETTAAAISIHSTVTNAALVCGPTACQ